MHPPGTKIGPYTLEHPLSQGGMACVFRAGGPQGPVAIKLPLTPGHAAALRYESELLGALAHPGIVERLAAGQHEGQPWFAMPLLRPWGAVEDDDTRTAGDEDDIGLREPGEAPDSLDLDGLSAMRRLCRTLAWMHGKGMVHRDLKPANLMLDAAGELVVVDLGIAAQTAVGGREVGFFETEARGTPGFMAPEQLLGAEVDARTDLYAVGLILFELLTGRPPFLAGGPRPLRVQHLEDAPPPPSSLAPSVSPELDALVLQLLAKAPGDRPSHADQVGRVLEACGARPATQGPEPRPYLYRPSFAGRQDALERVDRELADSAQGAGGLLLVRGPSGIGKTRFAQAASRRASGRPVLTGTCPESGSGPLAPLREALRTIADRARSQPPEAVRERYAHHLSVLAAVEPALAGLGKPAPAAQGALDSAERQAQLVQAAVTVLHRYAEQARPIMVVDDVQWADEVTRAVLEQIAASPTLAADATFLLLARPTLDDTDPLASARRVQRLDLAPLDEDVLARIVHEMAGTDAIAPVFVGRVVAQSAGSPLLTASMLEYAVERGVLERRDGAWICDDPDGFAIPASLDALLGARVAGLEPDAAALLRAGSVFGAAFDLRHASELAELDLEATGAALRELERAHTVQREGAWGLRFTHQRLAASVYASIPEPDRPALHAAAAARIGEDDARERFRHLCLAGLDEGAARAGLVAAREALDSGLFEAARAILESMPTPSEPDARAEREALLATGLAAAGLHKAAGAQAEIGLRELGRPLPAGTLGWGMAVVGELGRRAWLALGSGSIGSPSEADRREAELLSFAWQGFLRGGRSLPYLGATLRLLRLSTALGDGRIGTIGPAALPERIPVGRWAFASLAVVGVIAGIGVLATWSVVQQVPVGPGPTVLPETGPVVLLPERLRVDPGESAWGELVKAEVVEAGLGSVVSWDGDRPHLVLAEEDGRPVLVDPGHGGVVNRFETDGNGRALLDPVVPASVMVALEEHARNQGLLALEGVGGDGLANQESLEVRAVKSASETGCERGDWVEQPFNTLQTLPACTPWHVEVRNSSDLSLYVGGAVLSGDGSRYPLPADGPSVRLEPGATAALGIDWPFTPGPPFDVEDHLLIVGTASTPIDWRVLAGSGRRGLESVGAGDVEGLVLALVTDDRGQMRRKEPSPVPDPWTTTVVSLVVPSPSGATVDSDQWADLCDAERQCGLD